jgi:gamma-glutamylcyclotransferase (GGCT)/AIG2-like uncharacterized protein YtfP
MDDPSPKPAPDILFVYGTLRRGFPFHHHLKRLGAQFVGNGEVQAELSDFGEFPGARISAKAGKKVEGELYRLNRVASTLKVLDRVEGFLPRNPGMSLFQRGLAEVTLSNGERRAAFIYWLKRGTGLRYRAVPG